MFRPERAYLLDKPNLRIVSIAVSGVVRPVCAMCGGRLETVMGPFVSGLLHCLRFELLSAHAGRVSCTAWLCALWHARPRPHGHPCSLPPQCGAAHTLAISEVGTLWACGYNGKVG